MALFPRWSIVVTVVIAAFAALIFRKNAGTVSDPSVSDTIRGKNNTALFIVAEHPGFSNVHLATTQGLLELYPEIEVHYASFARLGKRLPRVSQLAKKKQPKAKDLTFHEVKSGRSYIAAVDDSDYIFFDEDGLQSSVSPPGLPGIEHVCTNMQHYLAPWPEQEHLALYHEIGHLIDQLDPAVVVLDTTFGPAVEATRDKNRLHAFITPQTLIDSFAAQQPAGQALWKYPA